LLAVKPSHSRDVRSRGHPMFSSDVILRRAIALRGTLRSA